MNREREREWQRRECTRAWYSGMPGAVMNSVLYVNNERLGDLAIEESVPWLLLI